MVETEEAIQVHGNVAIQKYAKWEIKEALLWKNRGRFGGDG